MVLRVAIEESYCAISRFCNPGTKVTMMYKLSAFIRASIVSSAIAAVAACGSNSGDLPDARHVGIDAPPGVPDAHASAPDARATPDAHNETPDARNELPDARNELPDARVTPDARATPDARVAGPDATPLAVCGNSIVESGEQCDDGNSDNFDSCANNCTITEPIKIVSLSAQDVLGNQDSGGGGYFPLSISGDGRYVAFESNATNLVPGDTNGQMDVFRRDRVSGAVELVSVDSNGVQGDNQSYNPSMSADGRFIAFGSYADNLVPNGSLGEIYLRDMNLGTTVLVSADDSGNPGSGYSDDPSISADGRYVAFKSSAHNMAPGDTARFPDVDEVYVRDTKLGTTIVGAVSSTGVEADDSSGYFTGPIISPDGRYVSFTSSATNLVPGSEYRGLYVHDLVGGSTILLSNDPDNGTVFTHASFSADDRFVAFGSNDTSLVPGPVNGQGDIYVHDFLLDTTTIVSVNDDGVPGDNESFVPSISADGRFIAFISLADNLVDGDTNHESDIFLRDTARGTTTRLNVSPSGVQADDFSFYPMISADGSAVLFTSDATTLVVGDTNGHADMFVTTGYVQPAVVTRADGTHTTESGGTVTISTTLATQPTAEVTVHFDVSNTNEAFDNVSDLTFTSDNWNVVQTVTIEGIDDNVVDGDIPYSVLVSTNNNADPDYNNLAVPSIPLQNFDNDDLTSLVSVDSSGEQGNQPSDGFRNIAVSSDGRYVAFASSASNLVDSDTNAATDIFLRDTIAATTTLVSDNPNGVPANGGSNFVAMSADGQTIAFTSIATDIVANDNNPGNSDVFVHDMRSAAPTLVSLDSNGVQSNGNAGLVAISRDGRFVTFDDTASNLTTTGGNGLSQVYLRDRQTGTTTLVSVASDGSLANGNCTAGAISDNGQFIAFTTTASNLSTSDSNNANDVYLRDTVAGTTVLVSVSYTDDVSSGDAGSQDPVMSADGRFIAFDSDADNLNDDFNGNTDVFLRDMQAAAPTIVSVDSAGSQGNGSSTEPSLTPDGRFVAFRSSSTNIVNNQAADSVVFVRDLSLGHTSLVGLGDQGQEGNDGDINNCAISDDSRFVVFQSAATNLVSNDDNGVVDVFIAPNHVQGTTY